MSSWSSGRMTHSHWGEFRGTTFPASVAGRHVPAGLHHHVHRRAGATGSRAQLVRLRSLGNVHIGLWVQHVDCRHVAHLSDERKTGCPIGHRSDEPTGQPLCFGVPIRSRHSARGRFERHPPICGPQRGSGRTPGSASEWTWHRGFGTPCAIDCIATPAFDQPLTVFACTPTAADVVSLSSYDRKGRLHPILPGRSRTRSGCCVPG
jgi:hypothetical protein